MTRMSVVFVVIVVLGLITIIVGCVVRARQTYVRQSADSKCMAQMALIGDSLSQYASDHDGKYPRDIVELVRAGYLRGSWSLVCPMTSDRPALGRTPSEIADHLAEGGHMSYVYIGADVSRRDGGDTPVLYERPENHGGSQMLVLFKCGRAEKLPIRTAWAKIKAEREKVPK